VVVGEVSEELALSRVIGCVGGWAKSRRWKNVETKWVDVVLL